MKLLKEVYTQQRISEEIRESERAREREREKDRDRERERRNHAHINSFLYAHPQIQSEPHWLHQRPLKVSQYSKHIDWP